VYKLTTETGPQSGSLNRRVLIHTTSQYGSDVSDVFNIQRRNDKLEIGRTDKLPRA